jgi:hypothetical protein
MKDMTNLDEFEVGYDIPASSVPTVGVTPAGSAG